MEESTKEILVIASSVIVIGGAIYWKFRKDIQLATSSQKSEGIITNWMATQEGGKRYFYPLIEFYDNKGQKHSFKAEERCEGQPMYEQGTKVVVKYLESDPEKRKTVYPGRR
ncbi:MAG: DUF3592 domain-containing protein [Flavobacteriales bacterium]|nr:DUF3592 domain-containing protein [Flavobacteriales bacterium]